jgi:1-acyl-sn-glycerol-3-phosphate acyltransferase
LSDREASGLSLRTRALLLGQREVGRILGWLWIPLVVFAMRFVAGWRITGMREARAEFRRVRRDAQAGLLICANHLTMFDSFVIAWALAPPWWYVTHYGSLAWNTPEVTNFAATWYTSAVSWLMKCVPVLRGGDRGAVGVVLSKVTWLLSQGETALVFPEGGRSRLGRVDVDASTYGVGRLIKNSGCRVLCVYLRGDHQASFSTLPARGEHFRVQVQAFEPKTDKVGLRGSLDLSQQILRVLAEMEQRHFDAR